MDRRAQWIFAVAVSFVLSLGVSSLGFATDVDGPDDCIRFTDDFGDAPESIPAYPSGVLGKFPTCSTPGLVGTQTGPCPFISTTPGPTGFVRHAHSVPGTFFLGCYPGPMGYDEDVDGKVNTPLLGFTACVVGVTTDCATTAFGGMAFDQDECFGDGSDAGLTLMPVLTTCASSTVTYNAYTCHAPAQAFLNILVDMNGDGDWNDNFSCPPPVSTCAYEWAVKNQTIALTPGCNTLVSPPFNVGPNPNHSWLRISITAMPMPDDFPWNGTASLPSLPVVNGETEDYPVEIEAPVPTQASSWGRVKAVYR